MQAYGFAVILIKYVGVSRSYPTFHGLLIIFNLLIHKKLFSNILVNYLVNYYLLIIFILFSKLFKVPLYTGLLSGEIIVKMLLQIYNFLKSLIIVYMYLQFSYIGIFISFIQLHVFSICFKLLIKTIDSHPCIKKCTMLQVHILYIQYVINSSLAV